jgi:hypothetical protein
MKAKEQTVARSLPEGWTRVTETKINGRIVSPGTVLSIEARNQRRGERWLFASVTTTPATVWLDVYSTLDGRSRTIRPDAVRVVHRAVS